MSWVGCGAHREQGDVAGAGVLGLFLGVPVVALSVG
jgi:hypothetical protein